MEEYNLGEPVSLDAELYNEGDETQRLNVVLSPPGRILRLVIENPLGEVSDWSNILVAARDGPDDLLSLAPGLYVGMSGFCSWCSSVEAAYSVVAGMSPRSRQK